MGARHALSTCQCGHVNYNEMLKKGRERLLFKLLYNLIYAKVVPWYVDLPGKRVLN